MEEDLCYEDSPILVASLLNRIKEFRKLLKTKQDEYYKNKKKKKSPWGF